MLKCVRWCPLSLRVIHAGDGSVTLDAPVNVLGHALSRQRRRYLQRAECVLATIAGHPVGLAAYHRVESDVRLVLEFVLDPGLRRPARCEVCGASIAARNALAGGRCTVSDGDARGRRPARSVSASSLYHRCGEPCRGMAAEAAPGHTPGQPTEIRPLTGRAPPRSRASILA